MIATFSKKKKNNSFNFVSPRVNFHIYTLKARPHYLRQIDMSREQSRRRVDMFRTIFLCRSTCQADRHSVGFQQRMSIDRLQNGRLELDKH